MFHTVSTPTRRFSRRRATGRDARIARPTATRAQRPMSLGEALAIGLGCDNYKR